MSPLGLGALLLVLVVTVTAPRRWALVGMVVGVIYLPESLQITVGGLNIFALRFIELAGFSRVLTRREIKLRGPVAIDWILVGFTVYTTIVFLLRSSDGQVFEIGRTVDVCLCYFTFRALVLDVEDFKRLLGDLVVPLIPFTALVVMERVTLTNPFNGYLGGTAPFVMREGELRAVGSFMHPSLLGTLGGSFFPLYLGLWLSRTMRGRATIGMLLSLVIVREANSGAPVACIIVGIVGWVCWVMRARMRMVRWGLVALIVVLDINMKAPIWYLLQRFSDLTGGDGYHRSYLLDIAFQNLSKWWLAGMPIADTISWFPYVNYTTGGADITNQFLVYGLTAGLGSMLLWIAVQVSAFSGLGRALGTLRAKGAEAWRDEVVYWSLGVVLTVHVMNWMSIPYFDQTNALWLLQLAVIASLTKAAIHVDTQHARDAAIAPPVRVRTTHGQRLPSSTAQWSPTHARRVQHIVRRLR